jgi:hypothetical protein
VKRPQAIRSFDQAPDQQLLDLKVAFERNKETDFWISHELLDVRLRTHLERKKKP